MINPENHKGTMCIVRPLFCQEGFCAECAIYQNKLSRFETAARYLTQSSPVLEEGKRINVHTGFSTINSSNW